MKNNPASLLVVPLGMALSGIPPKLTVLYCLAYGTLLVMTAESTLSKRPVLRFTVALFFLFEYVRRCSFGSVRL